MVNGKGLTIDSRRLTVLIFCLVLGVTVVAGRLVYYQIVRHDYLAVWADNQRIVEKKIPARRGDITDINGNILALNTVKWNVSVSPPLVTNSKELAPKLAELLGLPEETVLKAAQANAPWRILDTGVDYEIGEAIRSLDAGGVTCEDVRSRYYPEGSLFAHVVGIVNSMGDGYYGVEGYYNQLLRGTEGREVVETAPTRRELPQLPLEEVASQPGVSLVLTLDRNIQLIAQQELQNALDEYQAESGTVLIMDPQTGAVLANVSLPTYDPNDFGRADEDLLPDPAVSGMWEPGSIFKIITWAGALDNGTISPGTTFYDDGTAEVGGRVILNWNRQGNGLVTMEEALIKSLNTGAAFISTSMGKDAFYTYLRRFGFGVLTEVDLDSEGPGMMKLPGDSNWFPSELGTNSFGQGIAVTPIQMLTAASAVANRGTMMKPYIVHAFITTDSETGEQHFVQVEPLVVRHAISQETARTLTDMMVRVVEDGATDARVPGYRIAGKTGTAQIPTPYGYDPSDTIGSFIGFAPADDPQFIVLVKLDRPQTAPWGSRTAAPTFRAIAERLFAYMQIPPDEIRLAEVP